MEYKTLSKLNVYLSDIKSSSRPTNKKITSVYSNYSKNGNFSTPHVNPLNSSNKSAVWKNNDRSLQTVTNQSLLNNSTKFPNSQNMVSIQNLPNMSNMSLPQILDVYHNSVAGLKFMTPIRKTNCSMDSRQSNFINCDVSNSR